MRVSKIGIKLYCDDIDDVHVQVTFNIMFEPLMMKLAKS